MEELKALRERADRMGEVGADGSDWAEVTRLLARFKVDEWKADRAVRDQDVEMLREIVKEIEDLKRREDQTRGY